MKYTYTLTETTLWRRAQVHNIWFYSEVSATGISFFTGTVPKKQIILEDYSIYMLTDLFLLVSAWLHLTVAQTPWKWKDINSENGQSKPKSKYYSHFSLSKFCRLVFTWNFFLQNLESPLNNLREKKQKKLYISYCIEKKIIIMLVEIW